MDRYTEETEMPFGKYNGRAMKDVPVEYLKWLWVEKDFNKNFMNPVARWIRDNRLEEVET